MACEAFSSAVRLPTDLWHVDTRPHAESKPSRPAVAVRRHASRGSLRSRCAPIASICLSRGHTRPQRKLGELERLRSYVNKLGEFEKTSHLPCLRTARFPVANSGDFTPVHYLVETRGRGHGGQTPPEGSHKKARKGTRTLLCASSCLFVAIASTHVTSPPTNQPAHPWPCGGANNLASSSETWRLRAKLGVFE